MKQRIIQFLIACTATVCSAKTESSLPESTNAAQALGYATVGQALESLKAKPGVTINVTKPDGWVIINEQSPAFALWSFTPESHYAYPAVVRRVIQQRPNGDVHVEMTALCQAAKDPCDKLIREFQELNERMREQVRARLQGKTQQ